MNPTSSHPHSHHPSPSLAKPPSTLTWDSCGSSLTRHFLPPSSNPSAPSEFYNLNLIMPLSCFTVPWLPTASGQRPLALLWPEGSRMAWPLPASPIFSRMISKPQYISRGSGFCAHTAVSHLHASVYSITSVWSVPQLIPSRNPA